MIAGLPSFATNLKKTFERVKRQQRSQEKSHSNAAHGAKVVNLVGIKKTTFLDAF